MALTGYSHTDDAVAHHAANVAAVVFPVASVMLNLPAIITVVVGVLGIVWYAILIGEKIAMWRKGWHTVHTVTVTETTVEDHKAVPGPAPAIKE